jgi:hypothetical protein
MIELKTRFATDADAEAISALVNAAFKVERFLSTATESIPARFAKCCATASTCWLKMMEH